NLIAVVTVENRFGRGPESIADILLPPGLSGLSSFLDVDQHSLPVDIDPLRRITIFPNQALLVSTGSITSPPDHILRQDVRGNALVQTHPQLIGSRVDLRSRRDPRMIEANVEAPEHKQQGRDGFPHPVIDRRSPSVHVFPPLEQVTRPCATDL